MHQADLKAKVRKIEIVNKATADSWTQSIRVQLDDIELTNENLLELKQFYPNEQVLVVITPIQLDLLDQPKPIKASYQPESLQDDDGPAFELVEGEVDETGVVEREWSF